MTYTMTKETVTDNFDINIFDYAQYDNPEGDDHLWKLCPYRLDWDGTNYSISDELSEMNLTLTLEEARALTLGVAKEDGGDYEDHEDFWIDVNSFKETYKSIPKSVQTWIDFVTLNL